MTWAAGFVVLGVAAMVCLTAAVIAAMWSDRHANTGLVESFNYLSNRVTAIEQRVGSNDD